MVKQEAADLEMLSLKWKKLQDEKGIPERAKRILKLELAREILDHLNQFYNIK